MYPPKILYKYLIICVGVLIYQFVINYFSPYNKKDFLVFLNVGQGDSILVGSQNKYLLVDAGPSSSSTNSLYKYTFNKKPNSLLLTHSHSDHFSGFYKFANSSLNYDLFHTEKALNIYNKKLNLKNLHVGDELGLGNFTLKTLGPSDTCDRSNPNLCSIVLLLTHKNGRQVVLFGDAENSAQDDVFSSLPNSVFAVKVAHHGSKDSFNKRVIDKLSPEIAFISVGKNNYGHPSILVQNYYESLGTKVYRADKEGDVVLFFD